MQGINKNTGKRGTTWTAIVEGNRDPITGKRKQLKKTFRTQREAKDWRTRTLHELRTGVYHESTTVSVSEYLTQWLSAIEPTVRPATYHRYLRIVENRINPVLGLIPLAKLSPAHVQEFNAGYLIRGYSPTTVSLYFGVLHRALSQAVQWQMIARNVCNAVDRIKATSPEMKTWNAEQVRTFLTGTADDALAALWRLAITTGMRQGELIALRWSDIDLDRGELAVRRTIARSKDGVVFGEPKSTKGKRSISLSKSCIAALRRQRVQQSERRLMLGAVWNDTDFVFDRGNGQFVSPSVLHNHFCDLVQKLELPRIRFHDLRHTAATLMLLEGIHPRVAAERLGHSDISMTLNLYSHVTPTMQRQAADRLDALLGS